MSSTTSTSSSNLPLIIGTVVVLLAAVGFAVFGGGDDASDFDLDAIAAPQVEADGPVQPGQPAPEVTGASLLGEGEEALPVEGEATMIVFLAHWCPACNERVPQYTEWLEGDPLPEGVEVRAVATAIDPNANQFPPDRWLERRDWPTPAVVDTDGSIANAYGVTGYPFWAFVDAEGNLVSTGNPQDIAQLDDIAQSLASGG